MAFLYNKLITDVIANRPAAGDKGRVFFSTDEKKTYYDNGTTWTDVSDAGGVTSVAGHTGAVTLVAADIPNITESQVTNLTTDLAAKVPTARTISTTAPLTGGGDLSANRTLDISNFTGDSGTGGAKGTVPAPASGDAAAGKFLKADGTWATPSGSFSSPTTTKGDLIVRNASADTRLAVGTDGYVLTADSAQTTGVSWQAATSGGTTVNFGQSSATASAAQNTITLGSTPLANSVLVSVNGMLRSSGDFSLSGSTVTLTGALSANDIVEAYWATSSGTPGSISLSSVVSTNPQLRATGIQTLNSNTLNVNYPTGSRAGDLAILCVGHGYPANTPAGWTQVNIISGSGWNGSIYSRVLTLVDIGTGYVTVTFTGSFNGVAALTVFIGATGGVREAVSSQNASGATSHVGVSTSGSVLSTDTAIYFGSNRANSTDTVSRGTARQTITDGSAASGTIYTEYLSASGAVQPTFNYTVAGSDYQATVIVKGP